MCVHNNNTKNELKKPVTIIISPPMVFHMHSLPFWAWLSSKDKLGVGSSGERDVPGH